MCHLKFEKPFIIPLSTTSLYTAIGEFRYVHSLLPLITSFPPLLPSTLIWPEAPTYSTNPLLTPTPASPPLDISTGVQTWNKIPPVIKQLSNFYLFKKKCCHSLVGYNILELGPFHIYILKIILFTSITLPTLILNTTNTGRYLLQMLLFYYPFLFLNMCKCIVLIGLHGTN